MKENELYAIIPKQLHEDVIKVLAQLPIEPYSRVVVGMLQELRKASIVEKENVEHKNEKK